MSGHYPWPPSPVKRYRYPRFVGGPHAKKKAPQVPGDYRQFQVARQLAPLQYVQPGLGPPEPTCSFAADTYIKHKARFGQTRMLEFWAHDGLSGESATEQLFEDMLSRCGAEPMKDDR